MIDTALLALAVERQIISGDQAQRLKALASEAAPPLPVHRSAPTDDENIRLISGFGDIFVTIGLALFLGSIGYFAGIAAGGTARWASIAVVAWALAEFFTRRRHMALPSIALLVAFASAAFMALTHVLGAFTRSYQPGRGWIVNNLGIDLGSPSHVAMTALVTAGLIALHFVRFRVPVSIAAGTAAVSGAALALLSAVAPQFARDNLNLLLLVCGACVFALAMRFDIADPRRITRRTDVAFWLHLVAAPLIVHPLIAPLIRGEQTRDLASAGIVLALFLALGLVALIIDRRAMLVSGLTYAGVAIGTIVGRSGIDVDRILPATLLGLGAFVLIVSAGWQPLRAIFLRILPDAISRRLPNPRAVPALPNPVP
jgi:hypothetical protein